MARQSPDTKPESLEEHSKLFRDLLGFVKVHLLYHASQEPIYGSGISAELSDTVTGCLPGPCIPCCTASTTQTFSSGRTAP